MELRDKYPKFAASMMCANLKDLIKTIEIFEKYDIDYLHIDVMDGEFVPNLGIGVDYINALREITSIPLDLHLMIKNPEYKIQWLDIREKDIVTVHIESTHHIHRALKEISKTPARKFIAINPGTPVIYIEELIASIDGVNVLAVDPGFAGQSIVRGTTEKVKRTVELVKQLGNEKPIIEVDGNITLKNAELFTKIGADMFVLGSSGLFTNGVDRLEDNIIAFQNALFCQDLQTQD